MPPSSSQSTSHAPSALSSKKPFQEERVRKIFQMIFSWGVFQILYVTDMHMRNTVLIFSSIQEILGCEDLYMETGILSRTYEYGGTDAAGHYHMNPWHAQYHTRKHHFWWLCHFCGNRPCSKWARIALFTPFQKCKASPVLVVRSLTTFLQCKYSLRG